MLVNLHEFSLLQNPELSISYAKDLIERASRGEVTKNASWRLRNIYREA